MEKILNPEIVNTEKANIDKANADRYVQLENVDMTFSTKKVLVLMIQLSQS